MNFSHFILGGSNILRVNRTKQDPRYPTSPCSIINFLSLMSSVSHSNPKFSMKCHQVVIMDQWRFSFSPFSGHVRHEDYAIFVAEEARLSKGWSCEGCSFVETPVFESFHAVSDVSLILLLFNCISFLFLSLRAGDSDRQVSRLSTEPLCELFLCQVHPKFVFAPRFIAYLSVP